VFVGCPVADPASARWRHLISLFRWLWSLASILTMRLNKQSESVLLPDLDPFAPQSPRKAKLHGIPANKIHWRPGTWNGSATPMTDLSNTCLEGLPNADSAPPVLLRVMLLAGCSCPSTVSACKIANEGGCCDCYIADVYTMCRIDCRLSLMRSIPVFHHSWG
jgi:hypothetical protein